MTLLFPLMWPVILTQSWTGLEINPILEIPIMKIAKNLYQPAELTWSIASTIYMRSNSFSVDSQSHLPHTGRPDLGLIIANLQLNWVPGTSPQTTLILLLSTLTLCFKKVGYLHTGSPSSKCIWQWFIPMKKCIECILWLWSDWEKGVQWGPAAKDGPLGLWLIFNLRQRLVLRGHGLFIITP